MPRSETFYDPPNENVDREFKGNLFCLLYLIKEGLQKKKTILTKPYILGRYL